MKFQHRIIEIYNVQWDSQTCSKINVNFFF